MGLGQNVLIFSLIISIFLYLGGVRVVSSSDTLGGLFNTQGTPELSQNVTSRLPTNPQTTSIQSSAGNGTSTFGLVDGLNLVFSFITFLFNFLGAELVLFSVAGAPTAFIYLVAVPLVFMKVLAVVTFIRGIIW